MLKTGQTEQPGAVEDQPTIDMRAEKLRQEQLNAPVKLYTNGRLYDYFDPTPAALAHVQLILNEDRRINSPTMREVTAEKLVVVTAENGWISPYVASNYCWKFVLAILKENAEFQRGNPAEVEAAKVWRDENKADGVV